MLRQNIKQTYLLVDTRLQIKDNLARGLKTNKDVFCDAICL